jgi:hypothetical protein
MLTNSGLLDTAKNFYFKLKYRERAVHTPFTVMI